MTEDEKQFAALALQYMRRAGEKAAYELADQMREEMEDGGGRRDLMLLVAKALENLPVLH